MGLIEKALEKAGDHLSPIAHQTLMLRTFGITKIPVLAFCTPKMVEFSDEVCAVHIPLNWRTRNHLGSMYFGVLAVGADCAGGFGAMHHIRQSGRSVSLIFKDFKADFVRRPMDDVVFRSTDGLLMKDMVQRTIASGERVSEMVQVNALCKAELVAKFELTLSIKLQTASASRAA